VDQSISHIDDIIPDQRQLLFPVNDN